MKPIHHRFSRFVLSLFVGVVLLSKCGSGNQSKDTPARNPIEMGELPAEWDARSDWSGSDWEVVAP